MAKKATTGTKSNRPKSGTEASEANVPVSKQTAGAVTGAMLGGVVGGPLGALAGGAVGAMVGDSSAKGKKPIKRAVNAVRDEIASGRAKAALQSVGTRIKSLGSSKKKKKSATKKSFDEYAGVKKKKKAKAAPKGAKSTKSIKVSTYRPKKKAKKKR